MPGAGGWVDSFSRVLGLPAKSYWSVARGGTGSLIGLVAAMRALETGMANYVVIACGDAAWSDSHGKLNASPVGRTRAGRGNFTLGNEMLGFSAAATAGGLHAFFATRHMHEYGATKSHVETRLQKGSNWLVPLVPLQSNGLVLVRS